MKNDETLTYNYREFIDKLKSGIGNCNLCNKQVQPSCKFTPVTDSNGKTSYFGMTVYFQCTEGCPDDTVYICAIDAITDLGLDYRFNVEQYNRILNFYKDNIAKPIDRDPEDIP